MQDTTNQPTKIFQCVRFGCKFWVEPSDKFCPNCGAMVPKTSLGRVFQKTSKGFLGCFQLVVCGFGLMAALAIFAIFESLAMPAAIFGAICLAPIVIKIVNSLRERVESSRRPNLRKEERRIEAILQKLLQKKAGFEKKIQSIFKRQGRGGGLAPIQEKLQKALDIIDRQINDTQTWRWKIELTRWANGLKPLTAQYYEMSTERECKAAMDTLSKIQKSGLKLLTKWQKRPNVMALEKGRRLMDNLEQTLHSCDALTEELMAKQADFAVKSISDMSVFTPPQDSAPLNQIYTMMAMEEMRENGVKNIEAEIEQALNIMEAKLDAQESFD